MVCRFSVRLDAIVTSSAIAYYSCVGELGPQKTESVSVAIFARIKGVNVIRGLALDFIIVAVVAIRAVLCDFLMVHNCHQKTGGAGMASIAGFICQDMMLIFRGC
jgi:hypothetical protein